MAWEVWLTFFGAAIAISVSPGAGAIQSMATGLTHGVRRGYWSILGLEVGLMLQLALVAIGLGAAVANSILAFNIIKWIGVAYLVYLAVRQWRTATVDLREQIGKAMDGGRVALLVRGFLVNATNPKGLVFFLAVLPQFVVPTAPLLPQYLAVGVTMVAVDLVVMGLYTGLSVRLLKLAAHAAQANGAQPRVLRAVRRGGRRAVAGAAGSGYRLTRPDSASTPAPDNRGRAAGRPVRSSSSASTVRSPEPIACRPVDVARPTVSYLPQFSDGAVGRVRVFRRAAAPAGRSALPRWHPRRCP